MLTIGKRRLMLLVLLGLSCWREANCGDIHQVSDTTALESRQAKAVADMDRAIRFDLPLAFYDQINDLAKRIMRSGWRGGWRTSVPEDDQRALIAILTKQRDYLEQFRVDDEDTGEEWRRGLLKTIELLDHLEQKYPAESQAVLPLMSWTEIFEAPPVDRGSEDIKESPMRTSGPSNDAPETYELPWTDVTVVPSVARGGDNRMSGTLYKMPDEVTELENIKQWLRLRGTSNPND